MTARQGIVAVGLAAGWITLAGGLGCFSGGGGLGTETGTPEPTPPRTEVVPNQVTTFLSSNRTTIIRNNVTEGSAVLTVTADTESIFEWSAEIEGSLEPISELLDFEPALSAAARTGLSDEIRISGVRIDPGPAGTDIRVFVTVTPVDEEFLANTSEVLLHVSRTLDDPLTVSLFVEVGPNVAPRDTLVLEAKITGGKPDTASEAGYTVKWLASGTLITGGGGTFEISEDTAEMPPEDRDHLSGESFSPEPDFEGSTKATVIFRPAQLARDDDGDLIFEDDGEPILDEIGVGSVNVTVQVTDSAGGTASATLPIEVTSETPLTLGIAASDFPVLAPGGRVTLSAEVSGGETPYTFKFSLNDLPDDILNELPEDMRRDLLCPDGSDPESDLAECEETSNPACTVDDSTDNTTLLVQHGVSQACVDYLADGKNVYTDAVTVLITDAVGAQVSTAIPLTVVSSEPLDIRALPASPEVTPTPDSDGGKTAITVTVSGGTFPYDVTLEDLGPLSETVMSPSEELGMIPDPGEEEAVATFTFTAPADVGTSQYRFHVEDAVGAKDSDLVTIDVASGEVLFATAIASPPSVNAGGQSTITVTISGGTPGFKVLPKPSTNLTPSGETPATGPDANGKYVATFTFQAPSNARDASTYEFEITDGVFATTTTSATISILAPPGLSISASPTVPSITPGGSVDFTINVSGGLSPFPATLEFADLQQPGVLELISGIYRYTASPDNFAGTVQFKATVTDVLGSTATDFTSVDVAVDSTLTVLATPDSALIEPGGNTNVTISMVGGHGPYDITISQLAGSPVGGVILPTSFTDAVSPVTVNYAAPADVQGIAQLMVDVIDNVGGSMSTIVLISVGKASGLTVVGAAVPATIAPDATTRLIYSVIGGITPYSVDPLGSVPVNQGAVALTCVEVMPPDDDGNASTFEFDCKAPADQVGSAALVLSVIDGGGTIATSPPISVIVAADTQVDVVLTAETAVLDINQDVMLTATATGGTGPYDFAFDVDTSDGEFGVIVPTAVIDDTDGVVSVMYTAPVTATDDIVRVTVTDAAGVTSTDAVVLLVAPDQLTASAVVTGDDIVFSGDVVGLEVTAGGGVEPYSFAWSVSPNLGSFNPASADTAAVDWTAPTVASPLGFLFTVEVTDALGTTVEDQLFVTVLPDFAGSIATQPLQVIAGDSVDISIDVSGGLGPYTFNWTITGPGGDFDPTDEVAITNFSTLDSPNPVGNPDIYSVSVEVTDVLGNTVSFVPVTVEAYDPLAISLLSPADGMYSFHGDLVLLDSLVSGGLPGGLEIVEWSVMPDLGLIFVPTLERTRWNPPKVLVDTSFTLSVTVFDGDDTLVGSLPVMVTVGPTEDGSGPGLP